MCRVPLLTTFFAIILVQTSSNFCPVSLLLPCPSPCDLLSNSFITISRSLQEECKVQYMLSFSQKAALPRPCGCPGVPWWGGGHCPGALCPGHPGPCESTCVSLSRAPLESTRCQTTPVCRPLPGSFGNYLTASHRNARFGFTLFKA